MDRRFLKHGSRRRSGPSLCRSRKFLRVAIEPLEDRVMLDGAGPVFDAVADWSQTSNPTGVWSYGYTSTLGSPLILHTNRWVFSGLDVWGTYLGLGAPSTVHNGTGSTIVANNNYTTFKPDQLVIHPGPGGQYDVVRFTAPVANTYSISAAFFGVDSIPTTTDVHVLRNGVSLFDENINTFNPDSGLTFSRTVTLSTGDTLDFVVGFGSNGNYFSDSTGLQATITPVPTTAGDLAVRSVELPGRATVGELTTVGYTVQNVSNSALNGDWTDALYLSQDGLLDASDVLIGRVQHSGSLAIGETYRGMLTVPMPAVPQGTYSVIAVTDVWGQIADPVRADNKLVSPNPLSVDVRVDAEPLLLNQQEVGRIETPYGQDRWTFSAQAGQQVRFDLINTSGAGTVFDLVGPGGWVGFSGIAADSSLITLPSSGTYTLTAHGLGAQYGGTYAFRLQETQQTDLSLGVPYHGTLVGSDQAQLFRVNLPASHPLQVVLDDAATGDHNELYVKFGSPPTRGDYDYRFSTSAAADQQILVPMAAAGTWYILAYAGYVPTPSNFTLLATASDVILKTVTPDHSGSSAAAVLTLTGAGFDTTSTVALVAADGAIFPATKVEVDSFTQITATFAAGSVPAGTYTVRVSRPGGDSDELRDAFQMIAGGQAKLETNLVVPSAVGYHQVATVYVEYANTGDVAMPAPLLVVSATQNGQQRALLTLDQSRVVQGFWTSAIPEGFSNYVQLLASGETPGVLQPGESFRVPVYYAGWQQPWDFSYPSINFTLDTLTVDDSTSVDWPALKAAMQPSTISDPAWDAIFPNFTTQVGSTLGSYVTMLDDNASYLGRLGERVLDVGDLLAFEFLQAAGLGIVPVLASTTDAFVEAPGMSLGFSRFFGESIARRNTIGRFGYGWADDWQWSLSKAVDGTVTVLGPMGARRVFQPDSRDGHYFSQPGDYGVLTDLGGGVYSLRDKDGSTYAFRADSKLDYVQDTHGIRITCGYTDDLLTSLTHSTGPFLQFHYNAAGRVDSIIDSLNRTTTFTYDATNEHLLSVKDDIGQVTTYTYSLGEGIAKEHALKEIAYPGGTHQYYSYDNLGRLSASSRDGNAEAITFSYDSAGKVTTTDALGHATKFYFNEDGRIVRTEDPLGSSASMAFDGNGNLTAITDPAGRATTYGYDDRGNLIRSTDSLGHTTRFTYTTTYNQLATLTDANGNLTSYAYEPDGDLSSITYANGSAESWTHDAQGNAISWANRRGHVVAYTYDAAGRIKTHTYQDGSVVSFDYDAFGNVTRTVDPTGTTTFDYYPDTHFLKRITYPGGQYLVYTYDAGGRRTQMVDQLGHQTNYHYDDAGRLQGLTDETGAQIVLYSYDATGLLSHEDKGNGTYTTYEYDAAGNVLHLINHGPQPAAGLDGPVNSRFDYTYDSRGRRVSMATIDGQWTYGYDDLGQLTHAVFASANSTIANQDLTYVYDAMGNRIRTIENGVTTEYTTNNMNQYTKVGDVTYTYDADGNLIQKSGPTGTTTYTYNDANRMVGTGPGGDNWTYSYDAMGNRTGVSHNGQTTLYIIDPAGLGNLVGEYTNAGDFVTRYTYGIGLVSQQSATSIRGYYDFDAIGSTSGISTALGTYVKTYSYRPFGEILQPVLTGTNLFQFIGEWGVVTDASQHVLTLTRLYSPTLGRFASPDQLDLAGGDINLNRYVGNDPVSYYDASGMIRLKVIDEGIHYVKMLLNNRAVQAASDKVIDSANQAIAGQGKVIQNYGANKTSVFTNGFERNGTYYCNGPLARVAVRGVVIDLIFRLNIYLAEKLGIAIGDLYCDWYKFNEAMKDPRFRDLFFKQYGHTWIALAYLALSRDPNDKIGPAGFGSSGFISGDGLWPYTIRFENDAKATAPAQVVTITDQLDSNLDWNTFELTEIGFGDQRIAIPSGSQHFDTIVPMTYNGQTFNVQIVAGINPATGQVSASFWSIDSSTSLPPDVLTGFLPPENGTGRGQGFVSYTVRPKANLPTGTQIRNIALVNFDGLETIATNQIDPHDPSKGTDPHKEALNTFDVGVPTSRVEPLPATSPTSFTVNMSGTDDTNGSGIASFDLYVSDNDSENDGPFTLAQAGILAQAGSGGTFTGTTTFTGLSSHTYGFYSVATDNVGHQQATPAVAQTTTTVQEQTQQPTSLAVASGAVTYGGMTTLTATLTAGRSPLASETVTFTLNGASFPNNTATTDSHGVATISNVSLSGLNAGTYTNYVGARFAGDSTYLASSGSSNLTVNQATPTVSVTAPDATYDGTAHGATVSSVTGVSGTNLGAASSFTYYVGAGIGGTSLGGTPPTNVGTYTVVAHYAGSTNYTAADSAAATFQIAARPITVTADPKTKVYGTADPMLTYHITSGNLVGSDSISGSLSRAPGENVGPYAIGQGMLTAGTNYNLTYVGNNLTITARPITVTADPKTKVYGTLDPPLTFTVGGLGLATGDTQATVFTGGLTRDAGETVTGGPYTIRQGNLAANSNYSITFNTGQLTITPAGTTAGVSATSVQYSDVSTFTVTLKPASIFSTAPAASVQFQLSSDGTNWTNVGSLQSLVASNGVLTATISPKVTVPAGSYTVKAVFGGVNPNFAVSNPTTTLIDTTEDAFVANSGDSYVLTAGPTITTAPVRLAAQVTQAADGSLGDITKAVVTFNLFNGSVSTTPYKTVTAPVDSTGYALAVVNLPVDSWTVSTIVTNGYYKSSAEVTTVDVVLGSTERRTTGGGWIPENRSGNTKANYGYTVSYGSNNSPKGQSVFVIQGSSTFGNPAYAYVVKSNSWQGGGLSFSNTTDASFSGKAVIQVIDRSTGLVNTTLTQGNCTFTVDVTDGDLATPKTTDKYGIRVLDQNGVLWYSTTVSGSYSKVALGGGQVKVQNVKNLLSAGPEVTGSAAPPLTQGSLAPIVEEAKVRWLATGLNSSQQAALNSLTFQVEDLPGNTLGAEDGGMVALDFNAAGYGWFVDPTPGDDSEFDPGVHGPTRGHVDLLSVVAHEMGHELGFGDDDGNDVMNRYLVAGVRHVPASLHHAAGAAEEGQSSVIDSLLSPRPVNARSSPSIGATSTPVPLLATPSISSKRTVVPEDQPRWPTDKPAVRLGDIGGAPALSERPWEATPLDRFDRALADLQDRPQNGSLLGELAMDQLQLRHRRSAGFSVTLFPRQP